MKQCELIEKILIKDGTKGASEKAEIFIPNMTCSFNDIKYIEEKEEKMSSCTRREFPGKLKIALVMQEIYLMNILLLQ